MKSIQSDPQKTDSSGQRLDIWLWASRFYKSRKLATSAVTAGHIRIKGAKTKPGKLIKPGDGLSIRKHHQLYHLIILKLARNRLSAQLAQELYQEPQWSIENREQQIERAKNNRLGIRFNLKKPDKRERQRLVAIKQQTSNLSRL